MLSAGTAFSIDSSSPTNHTSDSSNSMVFHVGPGMIVMATCCWVWCTIVGTTGGTGGLGEAPA
eukprot:6077364-Amphidinium_carterae.1